MCYTRLNLVKTSAASCHLDVAGQTQRLAMTHARMLLVLFCVMFVFDGNIQPNSTTESFGEMKFRMASSGVVRRMTLKRQHPVLSVVSVATVYIVTRLIKRAAVLINDRSLEAGPTQREQID